jgi:hypothetical protein
MLLREEADQQRGLRQQQHHIIKSHRSLYFDALTYQVTTATILITSAEFYSVQIKSGLFAGRRQAKLHNPRFDFGF